VQAPYWPVFYQFELLDLLRRLSLTGMPSLLRLWFGANSGADICFGAFVAYLSSYIYSGLNPYSNTFDKNFMRPVQHVLLITIICGTVDAMGGKQASLLVTIVIFSTCLPLFIALLIR
jgi:hypothetical protein